MKANYKMPVVTLASVILGALAIMLSVIAMALAQDTVRVRGTIERIDGSTYMVKARDGAELKVTLADSPQIAGVVKASLSDIKQGSFVGITGMPRPDGSQTALEVHIFPESMRGTGEGHYPWDLRPQSTMTNANVQQIVTAVDGPTLTLKSPTCRATRPISSREQKSSSWPPNKPMERCKAARGGSVGMV